MDLDFYVVSANESVKRYLLDFSVTTLKGIILILLACVYLRYFSVQETLNAALVLYIHFSRSLGFSRKLAT